MRMVVQGCFFVHCPWGNVVALKVFETPGHDVDGDEETCCIPCFFLVDVFVNLDPLGSVARNVNP